MGAPYSLDTLRSARCRASQPPRDTCQTARVDTSAAPTAPGATVHQGPGPRLGGPGRPGDHAAGPRPDGPQPGVLRRRRATPPPRSCSSRRSSRSCPPSCSSPPTCWPAWPTRGVGAIVHGVLVAALGALFGNVLIRGLGVDGAALAAVAAVLGAAVALLVARARAGRLLLQYLAAANVLFLAGFLFASPTSDLISRRGRPRRARLRVGARPPGPGGGDRVRRAPAVDAHAIGRHHQRRAVPRLRSAGRRAPPGTGTRAARTTAPSGRVPALMTGTVVARPAHADGRRLPPQPPRRSSARRCPSSATSRSPTCARPARARRARASRSRRRWRTRSSSTGTACCPERSRADLPPIDDAWGSFGDTVGSVAAARRRRPAAARPTRQPATRSSAGTVASTRSARPRRRPPAWSSTGWPSTPTPALHFVHVVIPARAVVRHAVGHPPDAAHAGVGGGPDQPGLRVERADPLPAPLAPDRARPTSPWARCSTTWRARRSGRTRRWWSSPTTARARSSPTSGASITDANVEEVFRVPFFLKAAGQVRGRGRRRRRHDRSTCSPR